MFRELSSALLCSGYVFPLLLRDELAFAAGAKVTPTVGSTATGNQTASTQVLPLKPTTQPS